MKKLFLLFTIVLPLFAVAQKMEGEIRYKETVKFEIEIPEEHKELMKDMLPSSQTSTKILYFNQNETLFTDYEAPEEETVEHQSEDGGVQMKMVMMRPENKIYKDLAGGKKVELQEFFGKKFLVKDDLKDYKWKLTGEQKKVLDYVCSKATYQDTSQTVVVWFAPQIPVSSGPNNLGKLPGMILEVDVNDGNRIYVATKVDFKKLDKNVLVAPSKGKVVTDEELDKIMAEKTKEMQEEMGGNGSFQIKIGH